MFPKENWTHGLIDLGNQGDDIFYYIFKSRNPSSNKIVLWLEGGPGNSGSMGLFE